MRWKRLFRARPRDEEISEEIEAHLRMAVAERVGRGESPEEARRAARLELGNATLAKEDTRSVWTWTLLEQVLWEVRCACRSLAAAPWRSALAISLLAVGVGASAAAFTAVQAILFPELPFDDPNRVLVIHHRGEAGGQAMNFPGVFGPVDFVGMKQATQVFEDVEGWNRAQGVVNGADRPEGVLVETVSSGLFGMLDAEAELGRVFLEEEYRAGAQPVAVIGKALAARQFGAGSPIGATLLVDGEPHTVVGVMPRGFQIPHPLRAEAWTPLRLTPEQAASRRGRPIRVMAELKPGVSLRQAETWLADFGERMNAEHGLASFRTLELIATPLPRVLVGNVAATLWTLAGAVGFVLLIACSNVAALLVARLLARQREISVRAALGATRARLLGQFLVEALVLYAPAGLGAVVVAWALLRALHATVPALLPGAPLATATIPGLDSATAGTTTVSFIAVCGLVIAVLLSVPLFGFARRLPLGLLVSGQVALTTLLLIGAGLMVRSFLHLISVSPGYDREHILAVPVPLARHSFPDRKGILPHRQRMLRRVEQLPGVDLAAYSVGMPTNGPAMGFHPIEEGQESPSLGEIAVVGLDYVSDGYFSTLGVPVVEGRTFDERDRSESPSVVVVNQAMADKFWPSEEAIGKRLRNRGEIIGIVGNVKSLGGIELGDRSGIDSALKEASPIAYQSIRQSRPNFTGVLFVRTTVEPQAMAAMLAREIREVDPSQPAPTVRTLESLYSAGVWRPRLAMRLMTGLAAIAFLITAAGIYGCVSYIAAGRTKEIGVRMALGANGWDVVAAVARRVVVMAVAGVGIGLLTAQAVSRLLQSQIYGYSSRDPATYVSACVIILLFAGVASLIPALRAAKADPMIALRHE